MWIINIFRLKYFQEWNFRIKKIMKLVNKRVYRFYITIRFKTIILYSIIICSTNSTKKFVNTKAYYKSSNAFMKYFRMVSLKSWKNFSSKFSTYFLKLLLWMSRFYGMFKKQLNFMSERKSVRAFHVVVRGKKL